MKHSTVCEELENAGFAIIPGVFDTGSLEKVEQELASARLRHGRAGIRHVLRGDGVASLAEGPALLAFARAVLGDRAFPYRATFFEKTVVSNWLVVWHQDTALPLRGRINTPGWGPWSLKDGVTYAHAPASALSLILALRVHLDSSISTNGPLRVLPKTHTLGVLSDDAIHNLARQINPVDCTVSKGGVVAMRPLIVHASSKSQVSSPRRVLHIEYAACEFPADDLQIAVT